MAYKEEIKHCLETISKDYGFSSMLDANKMKTYLSDYPDDIATIIASKLPLPTKCKTIHDMVKVICGMENDEAFVDILNNIKEDYGNDSTKLLDVKKMEVYFQDYQECYEGFEGDKEKYLDLISSGQYQSVEEVLNVMFKDEESEPEDVLESIEEGKSIESKPESLPKETQIDKAGNVEIKKVDETKTKPAESKHTSKPATAAKTDSKPATNQKYTRFEKARIIGARALQISYGAPVLVDYPDDMIDPIDIALLEYEAGLIPITVVRN